IENTFRFVNVALVNELAQICHKLDIDVRDCINAAATKPFGYMPFYPSPGVGGHCIPIDPHYLLHATSALEDAPARFIELAESVNSAMPMYVVDRLNCALSERGQDLSKANVLLLGVTYKRDVPDIRESPARPVARELVKNGATISYHDPFIESWDAWLETDLICVED